MVTVPPSIHHEICLLLLFMLYGEIYIVDVNFIDAMQKK